MRVTIPSALHSYTDGRREVEAEAADIAGLLQELERRYAGLRFRIVDEQGALRPHVRISVNLRVIAGLDAPLEPSDEVAIIMAFSGG